MFGYIICNRKALSKKEIARYQSYYCGLCKTLARKYGQLERLSLNYDTAFVALFLAALYEPQEHQWYGRCLIHPVKRKQIISNEFLDYAADMTIALTYHKCRDDWADEKKVSSRQYAHMIKKEYASVKDKYPRQCEKIEQSLWRLSIIEKSPDCTADDAINCSGEMLSEIFVYKEDFWSNCLRKFGYELGRFIYIMDAAMDYDQDLKKNNYNPLIKMGKKPREAEQDLVMAIGNATEQFEKLPIIQDENLIRNILYAGVWQKYAAKFYVKEKKKDGI